jgi:hypothetical protein
MNRMTIACLFFASTVLTGQVEQPTITLGMIPYQIGAAVAITHLGATDDFPFKTIGIKNLKDDQISSIRLGIILAPLNAKGVRSLDRILVSSAVIPVSLEGGVSKDLADLAPYFPAFLDGSRYFGASRVDAMLGVLSIRFANGSEWTSEAPTTLRFPSPENSGASTPCKDSPMLLASNNPNIVLAVLQCDADSKSPTTCQVSGGTSCVVTSCACAPQGCSCGPGNACECRKCAWH